METPQDSSPTTRRLAPTRPQTVRLPSRNQEACRSAFRRSRNGEDPRHFPSAVSLRRPFATACPPCRSTLLLRTHTSRVTLRLRQCAAIAVCRLPPSEIRASSAQPAIAASDALAQPQEGHAQANAAGVRPSPVAAAYGVAGFGSGLPGIPARQPLLSRRRRNVTPKVSPPGAAFKERVALRRHPGGRAVAAECATPTPSLIRLRLTGGTPSLRSPMRCSLRSPVYEVGPRRAFFHLRRRAGPLRLRLRWCRRVAAPWKDSTSPDNTTNNQTHLPQDRQDPHPRKPAANPDAAPTTPLCA